MDKKRLAELKCLTMVFGYTLRDEQLFNKSLTHKSFANENQHQGLEIRHNERFEFLGDSVIDLIISRYMVFQNRNMTEGELSKIRAQLVNEYSLAEFAKSIGLGEYLLLGKGEEASGGRRKPTNLAGAFEAIIAAIFLDQGIIITREFILSLFEEELQRVASHGVKEDYKSQLQEFIQIREQQTPAYQVVETTGPDHDRRFTVEVSAGDNVLGRGFGKSKKAAETEAARTALKNI